MSSSSAAEVAGRKRPYAKIYEAGWDRILELMEMPAGKLTREIWVYIARNCDEHNAFVASVEDMATKFGVHRASIMRATARLKECGALKVAKIGTANVYLLPHWETWRGSEDKRGMVTFSARVLLKRSALEAE